MCYLPKISSLIIFLIKFPQFRRLNLRNDVPAVAQFNVRGQAHKYPGSRNTGLKLVRRLARDRSDRVATVSLRKWQAGRGGGEAIISFNSSSTTPHTLMYFMRYTAGFWNKRHGEGGNACNLYGIRQVYSVKQPNGD